MKMLGTHSVADQTAVGRYRWTICALIFFATTINYMDHQMLGLLAPLLQKDIGWNQVQPCQPGLAIFENIAPDSYFYFLHSYYVEPQEREGVAATTDYGSPYCSVIVTERVWGTQFHPEKSGDVGLQLLSNFVKWVRQ